MPLGSSPRVTANERELVCRQLEVMLSGSMTLAQASVGAAATWPTSGTALITAEPARQGAATRPQPDRLAASRRKISTRIGLPSARMAALLAVSMSNERELGGAAKSFGRLEGARRLVISSRLGLLQRRPLPRRGRGEAVDIAPHRGILRHAVVEQDRAAR